MLGASERVSERELPICLQTCEVNVINSDRRGEQKKKLERERRKGLFFRSSIVKWSNCSKKNDKYIIPETFY